MDFFDTNIYFTSINNLDNKILELETIQNLFLSIINSGLVFNKNNKNKFNDFINFSVEHNNKYFLKLIDAHSGYYCFCFNFLFVFMFVYY